MCGVVQYGVFGERHVWYGVGYNRTWNTMVDIGDKRKLQDRRREDRRREERRGEERTGEERTGEDRRGEDRRGEREILNIDKNYDEGSVNRSAG